MHHLTLPPFDYISRPPYIVSSEGNGYPDVVMVCETLEMAVLQFFDIYRQGETPAAASPGIYRVIDSRGVDVFGTDSAGILVAPCAVATNEVLRAYEGLVGPEAIESFEMVVREMYVILKGGT